MNLKELIEYYDSNINKISATSKHYDSLFLIRSKVGSGKITNEPHINGKHYWINNHNTRDANSYEFFCIQNINAYEVSFNGTIAFSAHISVISILGRNNFGVDYIGGYYLYNKKKIRNVNKIAKLCVNKLRSNNYDCVIEPCKDGISMECVLLPGIEPLKYEPVSLNANIINRNTTSLNIIFNSKENDMRKSIKGEWVTGGWIDSSRKLVKSGRYIKSGTSNFADNRASVDFPLVVFDGTAYVVDEETGEETDERDYDTESWYYEDAYNEAKSLADEMGIELSDFNIHLMRYNSRDAGYDQPFFVGIGGGYYDGMQIFTDDNLYFDPEEIANDEGLLDDFEYAEDQADYDRVVKEVEERVQNEWVGKINDFLNKLCSEYGWMKLGVSARFSNGETWYNKIDNSHKAIKSGRYIKSGAGAGYDVIIRDIELDDNDYTIISDEIKDESLNEHVTLVEVPVKPCVAEYWSAQSYYDGIDSNHEFFDSTEDSKIEGGKATLKLYWYEHEEGRNINDVEYESADEAAQYCIPRSISIKVLVGAGWIHANLPVESVHFEDRYTSNHGYGIDEYNDGYDYETMTVDLICPNICQNINAFFKNPEQYYDDYYENDEDDDIYSSRKPIQSRITQRELKDMINQGQAIDITYGDAPEGVRLDVLQISKGTYGMNGALFKGSDGNLYVIGGRTTNLFRYV